MSLPKMNKSQSQHFNYMTDAMRRVEWDMHHKIFRDQRIPSEWHHIARKRGRDKKIKITIGVEAGLVRFFKSMGTGYQNRMNDVMSVWMHARLAGLIEGAETMNEFRIKECEEDPKPEWGATEEAWRDMRGE